MPPPLTFYIVYHKVLFEDNTKGFSDSQKNSTLMWVAVNEAIEKEYPPWITNRLLKEWEMQNYSPLYQMNNFYQNSFFYHLYNNRTAITTKYVGFGQYDQKLVPEAFQTLCSILEHDKADKLIGAFPYEFDALTNYLPEEVWHTLFIEPYNAFYKTSHQLSEFKDKPLMLLHTFIIPTWFFNHMMPFIEHITPAVLRCLKWNTRHLAGTLERVYALCLIAGILEGKFRSVNSFPGILLTENQRTSDPFRGIQ